MSWPRTHREVALGRLRNPGSAVTSSQLGTKQSLTPSGDSASGSRKFCAARVALAEGPDLVISSLRVEVGQLKNDQC